MKTPAIDISSFDRLNNSEDVYIDLVLCIGDQIDTQILIKCNNNQTLKDIVEAVHTLKYDQPIWKNPCIKSDINWDSLDLDLDLDTSLSKLTSILKHKDNKYFLFLRANIISLKSNDKYIPLCKFNEDIILKSAKPIKSMISEDKSASKYIPIYTRGGDGGNTSIKNAKVCKTDPRIEAIGSVDELQSKLGLFVCTCSDESEASDLILFAKDIQIELYHLMAVIAEYEQPCSSTLDAKSLEDFIDKYTKLLPPLTHFVRPGSLLPEAYLHEARVVCRRAERNIIACSNIDGVVKSYINRLSDALFTAARYYLYIFDKKDEAISS